MSATAVPPTSRRSATTRRQRPVAAQAGYDDGQGSEGGPSAASSVQLAATRMRLFLGVDQHATSTERQSRTRAARQNVDGGRQRVGSVAARPDGVVRHVVHLLAVDAVRGPAQQALRRLIGHVRRRPEERRSRRCGDDRQRRMRRDRVRGRVAGARDSVQLRVAVIEAGVAGTVRRPGELNVLLGSGPRQRVSTGRSHFGECRRCVGGCSRVAATWTATT